MIRYWVCSKDGGTTLYTVGANFRPQEAIGLAPLDPLTGEIERPEWLQIEDVEVEPGRFEKQASVNQALKNQIQSQEAADKLAKDGAREDFKNELKALKQNLKKVKPQDLQDAQNIRQTLLWLTDAVLKLEKAVFGVGDE